MSEIEKIIRAQQSYMIQNNVLIKEYDRKIQCIMHTLEVITRATFMSISEPDRKLDWAIEVDELFDKWGWE
jgi:hypothetical protein